MASKFSPSVNIIRDSGKQLDYVVTPNARQIAEQIGKDYQKGIRSFTIIGSYGTGKSSFLMALDRSIKGEPVFDVDLGLPTKKIETISIVGQYQSLTGYFEEMLDITDDFDGSQNVFDALYQLANANDLLVIYLDEFGKFLEYAAKNNPEKELYFIQQLAEFVNDHKQEILLVSTLHQNFEAYASNIAEDSQKKEWRKVKGRFHELTFNEPVEQLLFLAASKLKGRGKKGRSKLTLAKAKHILPFSSDSLDELDERLAPLDIISAAVLTKALQYYGQNERSLFTFFESDLKLEKWVNVANVYDYLFSSFYSYLTTAHNPHLRQWSGIQSGVERIEAGSPKQMELSLNLLRTIGLLQIFASKAAQVDTEMLCKYFSESYTKKEVESVLKNLEKKSIVKYTRYNNSYKIIEGTDVDFDLELNKAEEAVDRSFDIASILEEHFELPIIQAKEVSYRTGTPRLFKFKISNEILLNLNPTGAIDGYVNLIFNDRLKVGDIEKQSGDSEEAVLYGYFTNSKAIKGHIFEILKTKKVLGDNQEDPVARKEFENILKSHERLLSHDVMGSLYSEKVQWFFNGKEVKNINSQRELNIQLSKISQLAYQDCPLFNNELVNKHKISASIHSARKLYFQRLSENWMEKDLGFDKDHFPPEKTIYRSLLFDNGMHRKIKGAWELDEPNDKNRFDLIWKVCTQFLHESREEPRRVSELWDILAAKPYKLKLGLIDFWIPTFLFINRGDFALYEDDRFVPYLNDSVLYLMTRQTDNYKIKSFEISGLRLKVFNKYREFLEQGNKDGLSQEGFIESVRPFLVFYKNLNEYSKNTKRISKEAIELRAAILDAQDPEKTFFESIPKALQMDLQDLESSDEKLSEFAVKLNDAIDDLKTAYAELLNRIETFICSEILGKKMAFAGYKAALAKRYKDVKEHRLLPKQKIFLARLNSPLDDRDSWLASVGQSLLQKPLDKIEDKDEDILKDRLKHIIQELDNLQTLHKLKVEEGEEVFKLDVTTTEGMRSQNVRIPKTKTKDVKKLSDEVEKLLGKNKNIRLAVIGQLLQKELKK